MIDSTRPSHFKLFIADNAFAFERIAESIAAVVTLNGLCIIRSSVKAELMDASTYPTYRSLYQVERALRSIKTMGLKVRLIHFHLGDGRALEFIDHIKP